MIYKSLRDVYMYKNIDKIPLPMSPKMGFGNVIFLLTPSLESSVRVINNSYLDFSKTLFNKYYADFYYKEKIGNKKVMSNMKNEIMDIGKSFSSNKKMRLLLPNERLSILKAHKNHIVDIGMWMNLFFKYRLKRNPMTTCTDFLSFLSSKVNNSLYMSYNKIIYLPINEWASVKKKPFGIGKASLEDPFSILLKAFKSFGDMNILAQFSDITFIIADEENKEFVKVPISALNTKKPALQFSKLIKFTAIKDFTLEDRDDLDEDDDKKNKEIISYCKNKILAKNITGPSSVSSTFDEEPDEDEDIDITNTDNDEDFTGNEDELSTRDSSFDEELDADIERSIEDNTEELPEEIKDSPEEAGKLVEDAVKKEVLIPKFIPEKTEKVKKHIDYLTTIQDKIITQSSKDMKTKIIETSSYDKMVETHNENILTSSFANFDKSYNEKKLTGDIDNAIKILSTAESKVFVTGVEEVDSSDQANLKKTRTYKLEDEEGRKFSVKIDIPIIIEDRYLFLGGNKKIIEKQRILKPIAKTDPDRVQITSFYGKLFVIREGNKTSIATSNLKKFLMNNATKYRVKIGNAKALNGMYKTTMDFDDISSNILEFKIGKDRIILGLPTLIEELGDKLNEPIATDTKVYYGISGDGKPLSFNPKTDDFTFILIDKLKAAGVVDKDIASLSNGGNLSRVTIKINNKLVPIGFVLCFWNGFTEVMKRAEINHTFVTKIPKDYDKLKQGVTKVNDGYIIWDRYPLRNSLIMNSINKLDLYPYTYAQLDTKDAWVEVCCDLYKSSTQSFNLDQFKDFMIDSVTEEILTDMNLPTNITDLLILAVDMLCNNQYVSINNLMNMRIRGNEIIPHLVYKAITTAYNNYRRTAHKEKPTKIAVAQNEVIKNLLMSPLVEDYSALQPVLELEKAHSVTFKGPAGVNKDRAFGINKRGYSESMIGVCGISSTPDAGVGILRQLTLEPNIKSTRGYVDVTPMDEVSKLNSANLFTPAELLSPPGVMHDDPQRTSMAYKQSKYMLPIEKASPVLIGNKTESIIPYRLSSEFIFVAKDDGEIVEISNGIVVVKYKNGNHDSFTINPKTQKNSAGGFYIETQFRCDHDVGYKFKKGETLGYNPKLFTKNKNDLSASMNIGALVKLAIIPSFDEYEDSAPITRKLSKMLGSEIVLSRSKVLPKDAYVDYIVKVGDKVKVGDPLIRFDKRSDDKDLNEIFKNIKDDLREEIVNSTITTLTSNHSGVVSDIKIYAASDINEYSDSLKAILNSQYSKVRSRNKLLSKYANKDDNKFYKCGQIISESDQKVDTYYGKFKNERIGDGVLIVFFIKYYDSVKKGDKITNYTALKGITSHIIDEGYEPFSETRPDEEISLLMAPGAVLARKTPSVIHAMFGNKVIIELKRKLKENYYK